MPVVPEHVFGKAKSVESFPNNEDWVSAGPYVLTEVDRGQRYVMEAVTPYPLAPGGEPTLEKVVFRVYPDVNTEMLALRNGDIDIVANAIPPAQVRSLGEEDVELTEVPSLGWAHLQFNTERGPLGEPAVRQALAHAIDYEAIRNVVLQGQAVSADGSVLTPSLEFWDDDSISEWEFDPAKARQMLEDAGYADGLTLEMIYDQADPNIAGWAQLVRDTFAEAGVELKLAGLERNTYLARASERDFDIYAGSWAVMENPPTYLDLAFSTGGFINYGNVSDPELDKLIDSARTALSREEAKPFVQDAAQIIHDQVYDVVLYVETFNIAHSGEWEGFEKKPSELLSIINPQSLDSLKYVG
jgi:peptide/nickel transport system substrate-binding protein